MADDLIEGKRVSRREFLKTAGTALAAVAISPESVRSPEMVKKGVVTIDFFGLTRLSGVTEESIKRKIPTDESQAQELLRDLFVYERGGHGERVSEARSKTRDFFNLRNTEPEIRASVDIDSVEVKMSYDRLGNIRARFSLSEDEMANLVAKAESGVVNLSLQMGAEARLVYMDTRTKYDHANVREITGSWGDVRHDKDGNPIAEAEYREIQRVEKEREPVVLPVEDRRVTHVDGYIGEGLVENLTRMTALAKRFPEKMFVVAAGNPVFIGEMGGTVYPDISKVRKLMEERGQWPENIIFVGVEGKEQRFKAPAAYGADVYVTADDLAMLGYPQASSFATPIVSEIVSELVEQGFDTHKLIRAKLISMCEQKSFGGLLDLKSVKEQLIRDDAR